MSNLMRQILVDHACRRNAARRGGDAVMIPLEAAQAGNSNDPVPLDQLDEAMSRLEGHSLPQLSRHGFRSVHNPGAAQLGHVIV